MRPMRATAYLVLLATLFLWAGNWIVARAVRDDISPAIATLCRQMIVFFILLPLPLCRHRADPRRGRAVLG